MNSERIWWKYRKKSIGGATGSNYVGVVRMVEEYNYMTLTVNSIWGVVPSPPLIQELVLTKNG